MTAKSIVIVQFLKFSLIGLLNTSLHYFVFLALYRLFSVHYLVASTIGYSVGLLNSFVLNRKWTFKSKENGVSGELFRFLIVNLCALMVNLFVLKGCTLFAGIRPEVGQIAAICFSVVVNFFGNKLWTFRHSYRPVTEV